MGGVGCAWSAPGCSAPSLAITRLQEKTHVGSDESVSGVVESKAGQPGQVLSSLSCYSFGSSVSRLWLELVKGASPTATASQESEQS